MRFYALLLELLSHDGRETAVLQLLWAQFRRSPLLATPRQFPGGTGLFSVRLKGFEHAGSEAPAHCSSCVGVVRNQSGNLRAACSGRLRRFLRPQAGHLPERTVATDVRWTGSRSSPAAMDEPVKHGPLCVHKTKQKGKQQQFTQTLKTEPALRSVAMRCSGYLGSRISTKST